MKITHSPYNSITQQVQENYDNISALAGIIKTEYYTSAELTSATTSVDQSTTNVPDDTTNAWLIDSLGNYFLIVSTADSVVYIKWYFTRKGEKGETGATGATGAQGEQGVGISSIESDGYTQGDGFTITHVKATLTDGTEESFDITATDGAKGDTGAQGEQGVSVQAFSSGTATTSGGITTTPVTVTLTDGNKTTFGVSAAQGEQGQRGATGAGGLIYKTSKTTYVPHEFVEQEVSGWPQITSSFSIWTDGENIYWSVGGVQRVLDKSTSTWSAKTWSGLTSFDGGSIWTDGENIYYSSGTTQYVLDKSTSTWSAKTWSGLTSFYGGSIWTDGENIYYSRSTTQYVLDKSTSTWSAKTWSGLTSFYGGSIWTDGENIYYSNGTTQYVLDKSTSTWSAKTWSGLTSFDGGSIWTDGENIYYSLVQYIDSSYSIQYYMLKKNNVLTTHTQIELNV